MSESPRVPITARLMSGAEFELVLSPTDTVETLQQMVEQQVERQFEVDSGLYDVQLYVGQSSSERPEPSMQVAQLAHLARGQGHAVACVQAVVSKSVAKATVIFREGLMTFLKEHTEIHKSLDGQPKYVAAAELLLDAGVDPHEQIPKYFFSGSLYWVNVATEDDGSVARQFAKCCCLLSYTRIDHAGLRRFKPSEQVQYWSDFFSQCPLLHLDLFQMVVLEESAVADIVDPGCHKYIAEAYRRTAPDLVGGNDNLLLGAFDFIERAHPREAVSVAASEVLRRLRAPPSQTGVPPRAPAVARAEVPPQPTRDTAAAADRGEHSDEQEEEEQQIEEARRLSNEDAVLRENQEVVEALMRSKADIQEVIVATLNFHTHEVLEQLLRSRALAPCRDRVIDAGGELIPPWAEGALLLWPTTEKHFQQHVAHEGIQPRPHHIFMLSEDKERVEQALGELPRRRRPALRVPCSDQGQADTSAPSLEGDPAEEIFEEAARETAGVVAVGKSTAPRASEGGAGSWDGQWAKEGLVVLHTFYHAPMANDASEATVAVESAPAFPGQESRCPNPHRWRIGAGQP